MTLSHYARLLHFAVVKVYFEQLISEHVLDKSWLGIIDITSNTRACDNCVFQEKKVKH